MHFIALPLAIFNMHMMTYIAWHKENKMCSIQKIHTLKTFLELHQSTYMGDMMWLTEILGKPQTFPNCVHEIL